MFPQPWPCFTELLVFTHTCRGAFPSEGRESGPRAGEAILLARGAAKVCTRGRLVSIRRTSEQALLQTEACAGGRQGSRRVSPVRPPRRATPLAGPCALCSGGERSDERVF